jgi:hypothetical protein
VAVAQLWIVRPHSTMRIKFIEARLVFCIIALVAMPIIIIIYGHSLMPSPPWRIVLALALLALLFIPLLRRSASRWWLIGTAFIAYAQVMIPIMDIDGGVYGTRYDWPAWVLWTLGALDNALFISFIILAFCSTLPDR